MAEYKESGVVSAQALDAEPGFDQHVPEYKKGTYEDQRDMFRMGKAQEMRVWKISSHQRALLMFVSEIFDLCLSSASP